MISRQGKTIFQLWDTQGKKMTADQKLETKDAENSLNQINYSRIKTTVSIQFVHMYMYKLLLKRYEDKIIVFLRQHVQCPICCSQVCNFPGRAPTAATF